jgi:hypothetical protein
MDDEDHHLAERQLASGERPNGWGRLSGIMGSAGSRAGGLDFMRLRTLLDVFWTTAACFRSPRGNARAGGDMLVQRFPLVGLPFNGIGVPGLASQIRGMGGAMKATCAVTDRRVRGIEVSKITRQARPTSPSCNATAPAQTIAARRSSPMLR